MTVCMLCLNPITVYIYGFLFNCTTVGQASESIKALTGFCKCSLFCCTLLYVPSSFAIILMGEEGAEWFA